MARRRKSKNLSGTQSEHAIRQEAHLQRALGQINEAHRSLYRSEDCYAASDHLLRASSAIGGYHAENEWVGKKSARETQITKAYRETRDMFDNRCELKAR